MCECFAGLDADEIRRSNVEFRGTFHEQSRATRKSKRHESLGDFHSSPRNVIFNFCRTLAVCPAHGRQAFNNGDGTRPRPSPQTATYHQACGGCG
jgi:hypothetical protein